jgi:DNA topoisomerase-6 subunit B
MRITGGAKTDEVLGKNGSGPEGLPHSIIVTPEGVEGEVPVVPTNGGAAAEEPVSAPAPPDTQPARNTQGEAKTVKPLPRASRLKKKKKK